MISTLLCPNLTIVRADGNTTRQIDFAVQALFKGERVEVKDHWESGQNLAANRDLLSRIVARVNIENHVPYRGYELVVDKKNLQLKLDKLQ